MRITITLDADTESMLRKVVAEKGVSLNEALNQAVQRGLADDDSRFVVESVPMGVQAGVDPARLNSFLDDLEADTFTYLRPRM